VHLAVSEDVALAQRVPAHRLEHRLSQRLRELPAQPQRLQTLRPFRLVHRAHVAPLKVALHDTCMTAWLLPDVTETNTNANTKHQNSK